jgi:hypothetical protein
MCVKFYIVINIHILNTFQAFHFKLLQCLFLIRNIRQAQHKKCCILDLQVDFSWIILGAKLNMMGVLIVYYATSFINGILVTSV